jgi:dephospho-CoA kinase
LLFRDWLIADPGVAAEYLQVKRRAEAAHLDEPNADAYTLAKEPWMAEVYPRGLAWAERTGWTPDG